MNSNFLLPIFLILTQGLISQNTIASYTVTFDSNWSQSEHPHSSGSLPGNAHWSNLVGATHTDQITFFEMGDLATTGVENIAETGSTNAFNNEVNTAINNGTAEQWLNFGDTNTSTESISGLFDISNAYPQISLISMVAPSPDWIIGINNLELMDDTENWIENVTLDLYAYDAGTDSGNDYTSPNMDTNPAQPISNLQGIAPFSNAIIGTITFTLESVLSTDDNLLSSTSIFPNPTNGLLTLSTPNPLGTYELYDVTGKKILSNQIENTITTIDISSLTTGIYVLMIENDGSQIVQRVVKK